MQYLIYAAQKLKIKFPKYLLFEIAYYADLHYNSNIFFYFEKKIGANFLITDEILKNIRNMTFLKKLVDMKRICLADIIENIAATESLETCKYFFEYDENKDTDNFLYVTSEKCIKQNKCAVCINGDEAYTDYDFIMCMICEQAMQGAANNFEKFEYFYKIYTDYNLRESYSDGGYDFINNLIYNSAQNIEILKLVSHLIKDESEYIYFVEYGLEQKNEEIMLIGLECLLKEDGKYCFESMAREMIEYNFKAICKDGYLKALEIISNMVTDLMPGFKSACKYEKIQVLEFLISKGCNPNYCFEYGCQYGNISVIKFFISKNFEINSDLFETGIEYLAEYCDNEDVIEEIFDYFFEIKMDFSNYGLICSVRKNNRTVIEKAIRSGATNLENIIENIEEDDSDMLDYLKSFL